MTEKNKKPAIRNPLMLAVLAGFLGFSFCNGCPSSPPAPSPHHEAPDFSVQPAESPEKSIQKEKTYADVESPKETPTRETRSSLEIVEQTSLEQAVSAYNEGLHDKAATLLVPLAEKPDPEKDVLYLMARIRISQRRHKKAVQVLNRVFEKDKEDVRAHALAARAWSLERKPANALRHAQTAVSLVPSDPEHQRLLGEILLQYRRPEAAEKALRAALARDPESSWSLTLLGDSLWALNRKNEAAAAYKKGATYNRDGKGWQAAAMDKQGTLLIDMKRAKAAKDLVKNCKKLFPEMGCPYTEAALSPPDPTRPHRRETFVKKPKGNNFHEK